MIEAYSYKMKLFVVGSVFISYFVHVLVANQKGCSFSLHGEGEKYRPILLQNNSSILIPSHGKVTMKNQEGITLLCPDPKNFLIASNSNTTYARCISGKTLRVANQDVSFDLLSCKHIIKGVVSKTKKKCGNNLGFIYKIGYQMSSRYFIALIEVCYSSDLGSALYTEHLLHGHELRYASKSNYRPSFSPEAAAVSVSVAYKQAYQKATFNKLLKSALLAQEYINESSFLARGHLSPDADFLLAATQYTSYYYINTSPQWQAINGGNWKRIELMVRKTADNLQEDLIVITGIHGVLTLPDINGRETEIYLVANSKLPVPKFIWKIVYSKKSKKSIVLVSSNNPFKRQDSLLCENICNQTGWKLSAWSNFQHGLVHCCDYNQFVVAVPTSPKLAVTGVLQGPK